MRTRPVQVTMLLVSPAISGYSPAGHFSSSLCGVTQSCLVAKAPRRACSLLACAYTGGEGAGTSFQATGTPAGQACIPSALPF